MHSETAVAGSISSPGSTQVLATERLVLRRFDLDDADFIFTLVNDPSWLRFIGDKGVRNLDDARNYLRTGPMAMQTSHGFSLYRVELKASGVPIGACGLIKRETLDDVDIGFAFLPTYWGQGYALESSAAVLAYAEATCGLARVVAVAVPDNHSSIRLLEKLGMHFERRLRLAADAHELSLFARDF